jgi:energy-coupling factor transport system ATP-binding protein
MGVDLKVYPGRAHGLAGVTGSGKSTLLQHLNGLLRPQKGSVRLGELLLEDPHTTTRDIVKRSGLVFQNPEMQFFETYVGDEIAYGPRQLELEGPVREHVRRAMELVGLDFDAFKDRPVFALSGGERRKVALASVLANRTEILLLDEPTAGLDPHSHREILARLRHLQGQGTQIVISSHRMDDLAEMAQDLTVFRKGCSLFSGPAAEFFNRSAELYEAGLEPPTAVRAAQRLRELGWPVPEEVVNAAQLEAALSTCGEGQG